MQNHDDIKIGGRLTTLRRRSGLTLDEIAKRAGYRGRSSVQQFFRDDYDPEALDTRVAMRLAKALEGEGAPPIEKEEVLSLAGFPEPSRREWKAYSSQLDGLPRDVPIYFASDADHDSMELRRALLEFNEQLVDFTALMYEHEQPVSYAWRPPSSSRDRDHGFYGLVVASHALEPRHRYGEMLIIDEKKPARAGEEVVVTVDARNEAGGSLSIVVVGSLVSRSKATVAIQWAYTGGQIAAGQPLTGGILIPTSMVLGVDRIMTVEEMLGQI